AIVFGVLGLWSRAVPAVTFPQSAATAATRSRSVKAGGVCASAVATRTSTSNGVANGRVMARLSVALRGQLSHRRLSRHISPAISASFFARDHVEPRQAGA